MEKSELKYKDARRAFETLEKILEEPYSVIVRDAAIQRFEYTFEALWKFVQEHLKEKEGLIAASPKAVFRELLSSGVLTPEDTAAFLDMTDQRNDIVHTYKEAVAQMIFSQIPTFTQLMKKLLDHPAIRG